MTTEYSISIDWHDEYHDHPERWNNHGARVLREILEDPDHEDFKRVAEEVGMLKDDGTLEDYWEECLNDQDPMMNYGYPLHHAPDDDEILEIALNTSCSVMENEDSGEYFLALNGGGMDLSQSIAHAYTICGYIPDSLAFNVCTQYGLNISGETYFKVMQKVRDSLTDTIEAYKSRIKRIDEEVIKAKLKGGKK